MNGQIEDSNEEDEDSYCDMCQCMERSPGGCSLPVSPPFLPTCPHTLPETTACNLSSHTFHLTLFIAHTLRDHRSTSSCRTKQIAYPQYFCGISWNVNFKNIIDFVHLNIIPLALFITKSTHHAINQLHLLAVS